MDAERRGGDKVGKKHHSSAGKGRRACWQTRQHHPQLCDKSRLIVQKQVLFFFTSTVGLLSHLGVGGWGWGGCLFGNDEASSGSHT